MKLDIRQELEPGIDRIVYAGECGGVSETAVEVDYSGRCIEIEQVELDDDGIIEGVEIHEEDLGNLIKALVKANNLLKGNPKYED